MRRGTDGKGLSKKAEGRGGKGKRIMWRRRVGKGGRGMKRRLRQKVEGEREEKGREGENE